MQNPLVGVISLRAQAVYPLCGTADSHCRLPLDVAVVTTTVQALIHSKGMTISSFNNGNAFGAAERAGLNLACARADCEVRNESVFDLPRESGIISAVMFWILVMDSVAAKGSVAALPSRRSSG